MTFVKAGIRGFDRAAREHASLLSCLCGLILLLGFPLPRTPWLALNWSNNNSSRDEAAIDAALQEAATTALGQRQGTIVIMDARTGRVRAIVNREAAYEQAQMPGSAIKPFTTLAALRAGLADEGSRSACPGRFTGLSFSLPCVHADHLPPFSPSQALAHSCNYYFAMLGQRLGRDRLVTTLRQFGFGQRTGIAQTENAGLVRACEPGNRARIQSAEANHASTQADCDAREAVGESDHIQVTPIQLLTAYAALLNGGHLYEPRLADADDFNPVERATIDISSGHRAVIAEGMAGAIRYGTARRAKLDSLPLIILGKTGTALPARGFRNNGWFIGVAGPFQSSRDLDSSQVKLAVLVLLSRAHGSEAATVARPIFETYAKETSHRDTETQSRQSESDSATDSESPRLPVSTSAVRVHLVRDKVTHQLPLEDYVLGVVRAEGSMETELEALKALAIAARTYALRNRARHANDGYDFCSTTHCQRFVVRNTTVRDGANATTGTLPAGRVSDAVRTTADLVMFDDRNQVADSYFGASCGGKTANVATLWGVTPPEYLRGVRDEYCLSGPHATWTDTIIRADLLRALRSDARTDVGNRLDQVLISKRDETGRAEFISLEGEHRKTVRGWDFKIIVGRVLGWNVLKSSRFDVARSGSNFIFRGSGFGHGLGLCQEGAHVMAARGLSAQKILEKYFPGARVRKEQEFGDSRSTRWKADALNSSSRKGESVAKPRSGEIFIAQDRQTEIQLCRSVMFSTHRDERSYFAPTELTNSFSAAIYKYFVPTGLSTAARFMSISSEHFRITYPADVARRDADQVLNTLESARNDFARRATSASAAIHIPLLEVRLNESTGDFTARTGQPWWSAAATKGNRIEMQPLALLKRRGVLTTTLRHELAHVFIDTVSRDRAPRWLEEGFAIYLAGEGKLFSPYVQRSALSIDELEKRLERPGSQQEMRALYAAAYRVVVDMSNSGGEASVWRKLAAS